ncbi:AAA family ATPase [Hymenobacter tibetensis]|uniref:AAA family ATPase n=1 Tax=Hymenobacter tibetensis TaxID=497967 RepID=A0ABY4D5A4_9BACT|nr:AAA family ATPase [Hymenobacter tibetensis]UOG76346.1 AAA family ATPase [Hymenobacter tibetensis]
MPFHKGHAELINFARLHCDHLTVLVCSSDQEQLPGPVRQAWLQETYAGSEAVHVQLLEYLESELPNTSETSVAVSNVWADRFLEVVPECSLVVTSEPYGELVAARMGIRHLPFDVARGAVPIAASIIRQNPAAYWHFLPDSVKPYYVRKVVLLGTESTGKTTLATQLAAHFRASLVEEAGRDLITDSTNFSLTDLHRVAEEHACRIERAQIGPSALVIIDTDIHITQSYAKLMFGQDLAVPPEVYALNRADLYLYLTADVPYVQDGGRLPNADRLRLDVSHRQTLLHYGIKAVEISGTWPQRFKQAVQLIETLLAHNYN